MSLNVEESNLPINDESKSLIKPVDVSDFTEDAAILHKQVTTVFIHKYRQIEDDKQARSKQIDTVRKLRADRLQKISLLKASNGDDYHFRSLLDEKKNEKTLLRNALGNLDGRGEYGLCSSEQELDQVLKSLQCRMEHETISIKEEKQMIKDMKSLKASRPQVVANAALRAMIMETIGDKEDIKAKMKLLGADMDQIRKDQQAALAWRRQLEQEKMELEKQIKVVEAELDKPRELKKDYYQNRSLLYGIRELASKKDIEGAKEKANAEFENWFSQWSTNKPFRDDYEKRVLTGLDNRQMSRDGRKRNSDEKLIFSVEEVASPSRVEEAESGEVQKLEPDTSAKKVNEIDEEPDLSVPEKEEMEVIVSEKEEEISKAERRKKKKDALKQLAMEKRENKKAEVSADHKTKETEAVEAEDESVETSVAQKKSKDEEKQQDMEKKENKKADHETKETEIEATEAEEESVETGVASVNKKSNKGRKANKKRRVPKKVPKSDQKTLVEPKKVNNSAGWASAVVTVLVSAIGCYIFFSTD